MLPAILSSLRSVNGLKRYEVVIIVDFSEKYMCRKQCEIQSYHWCQNQISIHPMMTYYYDSDDDGRDLVLKREAIVCITDDTKHDAHAVTIFENIALDYLKTKTQISHVHQWTDGCPGQYKGKHAFASLSMFPDCSTEDVKDVLFLCLQPQVVTLGLRVQYLFEFTDYQKKTL